MAFQYERAGVPINALEMHRSAAANSAEDIDIIPPPPIPVDRMRQMFVDLYLRFGIPLRNDHLYRSEPQELEQGMDQYHWDGHLWWTDSLGPEVPGIFAPDHPAGGFLLVLEQNEDRPRRHRDDRGPVRAIVRPHS